MKSRNESLDHLKKILKNDLTNPDKVSSVIEKLTMIFDKTNLSNHQTVLLKKYSWNDIIKTERKDIESREKLNREKNKVTSVLLELIDEITDEEAFLYNLNYTIFEKILIVCRNKERVGDMKALFPEDFYKNAEVIHQDKFIEKAGREFDLVIYDNFPKDMNSSKVNGLNDILNKEEIKYVLFFGPETISDLHKKKKYSHKVYFSNSKFSIHSRLNEMLLFLKYEKFSSMTNNKDKKEI